MAFSGKQNRNTQRGQSLFTAARRPWTFFVARRRAAGAFFVRTPAWGPEGCTRALQHAAARSSARAEEVISLPLANVFLLGAGQQGGRRRLPHRRWARCKSPYACARCSKS
jgi:hypothetical protein